MKQKKNRMGKIETPAPNGRFCEMAALPPQTILCEIARLSPAGTLVKPPPRKAAGTLAASVGQCGAKPSQKHLATTRQDL